MGFHYVVLTASKTSPEENTLTVVEMQHLPNIENTNSSENNSCLKWTPHNGWRKVCVNFETDTDKMKTIVYSHRTNIYLKDDEVDVKLTDYQTQLTKRVKLSSYIDFFFKRCIALDATTVHI